MDRLFDLLAGLLRGGGKSDPAGNPLLQEAERELEEYLRSGGPHPGRPQAGGRDSVPEPLRGDFANLGLKPGASLEEVRRAHRRLLARYHPDRYARNPQQQDLATQISQRLNASFRRLREFLRRPD
jgi:DnaJ-domain-containing protein 1